MSQNPQTPQLYTVTAGQTLVITGARSVSVFANGGTATVVNADSQSMTIPDGTTMDLNADTGNTITALTITASVSALVTQISGIGEVQ